MRLSTAMRVALVRNKLLISAIAITFFAIIIISAVVAYAVLVTSPDLMKNFEGLVGSASSYVAIPPPYTRNLYLLILMNNIGHFWNPARVWVWVPFVGAFNLGYELVLNAVVIGAVVSFTSLMKGALYTIAGLTPHGVFEIPVFMTQSLLDLHAGMLRLLVRYTEN